jgi:hypothetical protein
MLVPEDLHLFDVKTESWGACESESQVVIPFPRWEPLRY